jgi:putative membrane protein
MLMPCPKMDQDKTSSNFWIPIVTISTIVFTFLVWWIYFKEPTPADSFYWVPFLPFLNCILNATVSVLLVLGVLSIKKGMKKRHITFMLSAGVCSGLFLISYLTYHHFQGDTKFLGTGAIRVLYLSILISHVLLSMVQVPLILGTFYLAFTKKWVTHKKVARITFPIWLYVSVTGVIIFIFLKAFN